jgi:hypothetical protein
MKIIMFVVVALAFAASVSIPIASEAGKKEISGINQQEQNTLTLNDKHYAASCGEWSFVEGSTTVISLFADNSKIYIFSSTKGKPKKGSFIAEIKIDNRNKDYESTRLKGTLIINSFKNRVIKGILKGNNSKGDSINCIINSAESNEPTEGG